MAGGWCWLLYGSSAGAVNWRIHSQPFQHGNLRECELASPKWAFQENQVEHVFKEVITACWGDISSWVWHSSRIGRGEVTMQSPWDGRYCWGHLWKIHLTTMCYESPLPFKVLLFILLMVSFFGESDGGQKISILIQSLMNYFPYGWCYLYPLNKSLSWYHEDIFYHLQILIILSLTFRSSGTCNCFLCFMK